MLYIRVCWGHCDVGNLLNQFAYCQKRRGTRCWTFFRGAHWILCIFWVINDCFLKYSCILKWLIKSIKDQDRTLIVSQFTMQGYKNSQDAQEETPMEETITVSMEEYQMMKEAVIRMDGVKGKEKNGKSLVDSANTPRFSLHLVHLTSITRKINAILVSLLNSVFISPHFCAHSFCVNVFTGFSLSFTVYNFVLFFGLKKLKAFCHFSFVFL